MKPLIKFAMTEQIRRLQEENRPGDCPNRGDCTKYVDHGGECYHMYQTFDGTYDCYNRKNGGKVEK